MFPTQSYILQAVVLKVHVVRHDLFKSRLRKLTLQWGAMYFRGGGGGSYLWLWSSIWLTADVCMVIVYPRYRSLGIKRYRYLSACYMHIRKDRARAIMSELDYVCTVWNRHLFFEWQNWINVTFHKYIIDYGQWPSCHKNLSFNCQKREVKRTKLAAWYQFLYAKFFHWF